MEKLYQKIVNTIKAEILEGLHGKSGDAFLTTQEIKEKYKISHVTAFKILNELSNLHIIRLLGHKYYLSYASAQPETKYKNFTKNSKYIGMHVSSLNNPFFSEVVTCVEIVAKKNGYNLLIMSSNKKTDNEIDILNEFFKLKVAGIISIPGKDKSLINYYKTYPLPCVFVSNQIDEVAIDKVLVNNFSAAEFVAKHLVEKEYKNFSFIHNNKNVFNIRLEGFRKGLKTYNFNLPDENIFSLLEEATQLNLQLLKFLESSKKPLGVFCYHDLIAVKLIDYCNKLKLKIPEDVGIIGFDNLPITNIVHPKISTVEYNYFNLAENAISKLLNKINDSTLTKETIYINTILVIKESTKRNN